MIGRPAIFEHLLREEGAQADHALVAALANADEITTRFVVEALLSRSKPAGLSGLIAAFHRLDEECRGQVLAAVDRISLVLREVSQSPDAQVRLNLIEIVLISRSYRSAYLLAHLLHDRSSEVRCEAGEALYQLAQDLVAIPAGCPEVPVPAIPPDEPSASGLPPDELGPAMSGLWETIQDRRYLVEALEAGLTSFGIHHHPRVIEAALWFVDDCGTRLWPLITVAGSRANRLAADAISQAGGDPRLVPFIMNALHHSNLRSRALQVLAGCEEPAFWTEWFRNGWRLIQPRVARGMAAVRDLACLKRRGEDLLALSDEERPAVPRALAFSGLPLETRLEILKELERRTEHPPTRRAAAWSLACMANRPAADKTEVARADALLRVLAGGAARPDPSGAAIISLFSLASRYRSEYPPAELLALLDRAGGNQRHPDGGRPDAPLHKLAEPGSFERYWTLFDQLDPEDRRQFGLQMLARTPPASAMLARQLTHPDAIVRLRALRIIRELDLVGPLADQLYPLSQDPQPEVRSSAIPLLGELRTPASRRIIHHALDDPDHRVQANAIEAIERWEDETWVAELIPKLSSQDNRVQANAVKALLRCGVREAAETLIQMLQSDDRARRISALWVSEQLKLAALLPRLVAMAADETDAQLRTRAAALVERLSASSPHEPADCGPVASQRPAGTAAERAAGPEGGTQAEMDPAERTPPDCPAGAESGRAAAKASEPAEARL